jgi:hypothetical protein
MKHKRRVFLVLTELARKTAHLNESTGPLDSRSPVCVKQLIGDYR